MSGMPSERNDQGRALPSRLVLPNRGNWPSVVNRYWHCTGCDVEWFSPDKGCWYCHSTDDVVLKMDYIMQQTNLMAGIGFGERGETRYY